MTYKNPRGIEVHMIGNQERKNGGEYITHLDSLELFWSVYGVKQYPISPEDGGCTE